MKKSLFPWMLPLIMVLVSFSQAYAFESPSGYQDAIYAVDWSYDSEPIVAKASTPESVLAKVTESLTIVNSLVLPYQSYTSGGYITYNFSESVSGATTKPKRGYIKVLFS